jgi:drug/metabolite transporter (DMT)-like permease
VACSWASAPACSPCLARSSRWSPSRSWRGSAHPAPPTRGARARYSAWRQGCFFGLFFLLLDGVDGAAGLWPVVSSRAVATVLLVGVAVGLRAPLLRTRASLGLAVGAGVLDAAANALFLLAVDRGLLSVVAVVVSLYPAATVLLARVVLGERMSGLQMGGLGAAVVAVSLLAVA